MFEPTTLPTAMSLRPRMLETSEATTSGSPVPIGDDGQSDDAFRHSKHSCECDGARDGRMGSGEEKERFPTTRNDSDTPRRGLGFWFESL